MKQFRKRRKRRRWNNIGVNVPRYNKTRAIAQKILSDPYNKYLRHTNRGVSWGTGDRLDLDRFKNKGLPLTNFAWKLLSDLDRRSIAHSIDKTLSAPYKFFTGNYSDFY